MTDRDERARRWLDGVLGRVDSIEVVRERAWGAIWKVRAAGDLFWLKLPHATFTAEIGLVRRLSALSPQHLLVPVAMNDDEGWILTRDAVSTLAPLSREPGGERLYVEAARSIAAVQRAVHEDESTHTFVVSHLPTYDADAYVANMADVVRFCGALPGQHPLHLSAGQGGATLEQAAVLASGWAALADPLGMGLDHNDFHLGNAYPGPLLSDWGDSVAAHPFASLRPLAIVGRKMFGQSLADEVRTAYLEAWGAPTRADELELAMRMASPQRMHAWRRVADEDTLAEWSGYIRPLVDCIALPIDEQDVP